MSITCSECERGPEACEHCVGLDRLDHETICDCGLVDFGSHFPLFHCGDRAAFRWVVVANYGSEEELRA